MIIQVIRIGAVCAWEMSTIVMWIDAPVDAKVFIDLSYDQARTLIEDLSKGLETAKMLDDGLEKLQREEERRKAEG
jgi:hypothetical protein